MSEEDIIYSFTMPAEIIKAFSPLKKSPFKEKSTMTFVKYPQPKYIQDFLNSTEQEPAAEAES